MRMIHTRFHKGQAEKRRELLTEKGISGGKLPVLRSMLMLSLLFSLCLMFGCAMTPEKEETNSSFKDNDTQTETTASPDSESGQTELTENTSEPEGNVPILPLPDNVDREAFLNSAGFQVTMLDVGQGLSILIEADGHYLLYDGGGRQTSSRLVATLQNMGITNLDYIIASHYDEDHISGLIGVLNTSEAGMVLGPDYDPASDLFTSLQKAVKAKGLTIYHPTAGEFFYLGNATIRILSPSGPEHLGDATDISAVENNYSIAVRISYGNFSLVITGDAESAAEQAMLTSGLSLDSDLYVAGHHGSSSSSTKAFVDAVSPAFTFISCGRNNAYLHPTAQTLTTIKNAGSRLFRTDLQGSVTLASDGSYYAFNMDATEDFSPGKEPETMDLSESQSSGTSPDEDRNQAEDNQAGNSQAENSQAENSQSGNYQTGETTPSGTICTYVVNINPDSLRFHKPTCKNVAKIADRNRVYSDADRETLIEEGYIPCGYCKP